MSEDPRLLIQCVGHRWGRDDGAGPAVADRLRAVGLGTWVREYLGEGTALMQDWEGVEQVFMVDAAYSGAEPGRVLCWDACSCPIPRGLSHSSTHRLGVADAVELGRVLGRLPRVLRLYAIEGICFESGEGLSAPVMATVIQVAETLRGEAIALSLLEARRERCPMS